MPCLVDTAGRPALHFIFKVRQKRSRSGGREQEKWREEKLVEMEYERIIIIIKYNNNNSIYFSLLNTLIQSNLHQTISVPCYIVTKIRVNVLLGESILVRALQNVTKMAADTWSEPVLCQHHCTCCLLLTKTLFSSTQLYWKNIEQLTGQKAQDLSKI